MLEAYGFVLREEDEHNWALYRAASETVIVVPKAGELVSLEILMSILDELGIDNATYFHLLKLASD
jgi:hypothetical protein